MGYQWSLADRPIGDEFRAIAREQLDKAAATATNTALPAVERVHEVRRRCKRLRALLRLVRSDLPAYAQLDRDVRDAARGLAALRDSAVLRQTLDELVAHAGLPPLPIAPPAEDELQGADDADALDRFAGRMRRLRAEAGEWAVDRLSLATLLTGLSKTYGRGRKAAHRALVTLDDTELHDWRKEAKYHWNQLRLLERAAPEAISPAARVADELGELLGLHHDLSNLATALAAGELPEADAARAQVEAALATQRREVEGRIARLGRQVFAETPKALRQRFEAYLAMRPAPGDPA
jgi:CHAD domain-containing protein